MDHDITREREMAEWPFSLIDGVDFEIDTHLNAIAGILKTRGKRIDWWSDQQHLKPDIYRELSILP